MHYRTRTRFARQPLDGSVTEGGNKITDTQNYNVFYTPRESYSSTQTVLTDTTQNLRTIDGNIPLRIS